MTTKEFLSENRDLVIRVYNANVKGKSNTTLKDFMLYLLNNYTGDFSDKNLTHNLFEAVEKTGAEIKTEITVKYTKPYSKSNHAKMVAYYGEEKTKQFYML